MVRYPYTLEAFIEGDAILKSDGSWDESPGTWETICRCNVLQNGRARQIKGSNGESFVYSFEVVMPANTAPIAIGTRVRIIDNKGINIFDGSNRSNSCCCCRLGAAEEDESSEASYPVQGFYKSGQKYEETKLWL